MGIGIWELYDLFEHPRLAARPLRMLDIGEQNLHSGNKQAFINFVRRHNDVWNETDLDAYAEVLALGAAMHPRYGGTNGAWLGELVERIGVDYLAFDIVTGRRAEIFDLNEWTLGGKHRLAFDIVLNCGTTEHVLNQTNSFRVMHDATKVGGLIYHSVPMTGFLDHGYFNYNPRLFWELARANAYNVLALTFNGPSGVEAVTDRLLPDYVERKVLREPEATAARWSGHAVPTSSLSVLFEKTLDRPFRIAIEVSTGVGSVAEPVQVEGSEESEVQAAEDALLGRLDDAALTPEEIFRVFERHQAAMPHRRFPLVLEHKSLQLYSAREPEREDLRRRLAEVERMMRADTPLLNFPAAQPDVDATLIAMDGREERVMALTPETKRFAHVVAAYHRYTATGALALFPLELERIALQHAMVIDPDNSDYLVRLGRVLTDLTPRLPLRRR